jgi:hypothetical protein
MVTNENYNFAIYSIMLTIDFTKKRKKKYSCKNEKWTFLKCPKRKILKILFQPPKNLPH